MKWILVTTLLLICPLFSSAVGGVWFIEADFTINGVTTHGYIENGFWTLDKDSIYKSNDLLFLKEFYANYQSNKDISYYTQIEQLDYYLEDTPFYIEPYFFLEKNHRTCRYNEITEISFVKIWAKNDIMSEVLTDLNANDKSWIQGELTRPVFEVEYFYHDLCYLSFYDLGHGTVTLKLLNEIKSMAENQAYNEARFEFILEVLKSNNVVVVNYCGC